MNSNDAGGFVIQFTDVLDIHIETKRVQVVEEQSAPRVNANVGDFQHRVIKQRRGRDKISRRGNVAGNFHITRVEVWWWRHGDEDFAFTLRIPNLDLKFFATAIILQRQTGGDLAEILDKIGHLIRERFKIWGQVQALTGEGRLSGIVLLALPPALFAVVYKMNPDYLMLLFTDPMGKKMLVGGIVSQLLGALLIRKIVNIRV